MAVLWFQARSIAALCLLGCPRVLPVPSGSEHAGLRLLEDTAALRWGLWGCPPFPSRRDPQPYSGTVCGVQGAPFTHQQRKGRAQHRQRQRLFVPRPFVSLFPPRRDLGRPRRPLPGGYVPPPAPSARQPGAPRCPPAAAAGCGEGVTPPVASGDRRPRTDGDSCRAGGRHGPGTGGAGGGRGGALPRCNGPPRRGCQSRGGGSLRSDGSRLIPQGASGGGAGRGRWPKRAMGSPSGPALYLAARCPSSRRDEPVAVPPGSCNPGAPPALPAAMPR